MEIKNKIEKLFIELWNDYKIDDETYKACIYLLKNHKSIDLGERWNIIETKKLLEKEKDKIMSKKYFCPKCNSNKTTSRKEKWLLSLILWTSKRKNLWKKI